MSTPLAGGQAVARVAALLAEPHRASICLALLDRRAWTAGELARLTGVAASTMSAHLDRLVAGGLVVTERQGRHRYVRLAGVRAAQLLEELTGYADPVSPPRSLRAANATRALAAARTCYDHLAGLLGVGVLDTLADRGLVEVGTGIAITGNGVGWFADLGVDIAALRGARRPVTRACLDWTERRSHLAGAAGAALCQRCFDLGWIERAASRNSAATRAVRVTPAGRRGFADTSDSPSTPWRAGRSYPETTGRTRKRAAPRDDEGKEQSLLAIFNV
ncbi:MAG: ArsR/SmtB family transcription factor [Micromonosporaceae bacterium]